MTPAPPLPDLLAALAQRVPERVLWSDGNSARIRVGGQLIYLDLLDPAQCGPWLEYALCEECDERGWMWRVFALPLQGGSGVDIEKKILSKVFSAYAPTPAHALACAMVAALSGEEEG